uniref:BTB domain-containing protein n=1 Tax=Oryza rufipogon TaxID=4529 RepID=A0A0E0NHA3_ORYRU
MALSTAFSALPTSPADVRVVTADGSGIRAHSSVLASASPVLERMIEQAPRGGVVPIAGASTGAVVVFLRFLYAASVRGAAAAAAEWEEAALAEHGAALMALAHAYRVAGPLKRRAEEAVAARVAAEGAVDAMKLAALCDAPRLYLRCARLAGRELAAVRESEGWRFAARHDAALRADLLQLIRDADQRKERWGRERGSQGVYLQLSDAMAALERVFARAAHGSPPPLPPPRTGQCCRMASPCAHRRGLLQLARHFFAGCGRRVAGGCTPCRRFFLLLRLHSSVCDKSDDDSCGVPLCSNFKTNMEKGKVDKTWKLLVKKVMRARVMSAWAKRPVPAPEIVQKSWAKYNSSSRSRAARFR